MAEASRFLEYEDDDEELSVKRSFAVPGPSYEEDHTREQFRQDFEKARMMQKEKADKLAQIQNDEQKAKMKMITQEYNEKFRHFAKSRSDRWAEKTSMAAGSRNFLHHLAYENSSSQFYPQYLVLAATFITKLISLVPKAMFNIQDSKGRTPLHLAVQYENCSPDQVLIVKELLAKGPEALSVESQELGRDLSIFQFHELSKENYEQRRKSLEQEEQKKQRLLNEKQLRHRHHENMSHDRMPGWTENKGPSKEEKEAKFGTDSRKSDLKKADSKLRRGDMEPPPLPDKIGKADANVAVRISRKNSFTTGTPQTREPSPTPWQPERRAVGGNQLYQAVNTPVLKSQAPPDHRLKVMGELESGRRDAAAAIAEILKLCCLRTYEPQKASRFLRSLNGKQGVGSDKALWFDFGPSGQPRKLRWKEFQRNFRHFQFDSILQYVAFPHIDLARKTSNQDEEEGSRSTADAFPMVALFNWLRDEERGVKRIIRVIVNDFDSPSHTDEAIEKALYNFAKRNQESLNRTAGASEFLGSANLAQGSKKLQIDPQSAIKAIEYATELGSHIISMSWTIKPPEEPLKGLFLQAVNSAMIDPKGILMFCAAADQGNFTERTFPHTLNSNIFRIGAAAATGKVLDKVGARKDLSFTLPGHEVVIDHWYDDVGDQAFNHFEPHSGSSVATALAAALAALIIECVRLGVIHTNACSPEQQNDSTFAIRMGDLKRIRERETMRKALSSINTDIDADPLYLQVWDLFEKNAERLKAARIGGERGGNEQLEIISGLARHFLRKGVF
ncbi:hypothetical protein diail_6860 [Diaporthe ilicicola]|nr:hypothetical protein diail_6860 [Diaporthe ilicicola]